MAVQLGLQSRAFTFFTLTSKGQRVTFAMPWKGFPEWGRRDRRSPPGPVYRRDGWPEDWPEGVDRASLAAVRIGVGSAWEVASAPQPLDVVLDDGSGREVPTAVAETFDLDPLPWVLIPVQVAGAPRTIACPRLQIAREVLEDDLRDGFQLGAEQNPLGAPPGWHDELLVLKRDGLPESWPGCEEAWGACHVYAGPTLIIS
jgi:hypothetical protein